jgi:hypothetical protein
MAKITVQALKSELNSRGSHYFDKDTMKFFGDTIANYRIADAGEYWELYRVRPVRFGLKGSAFFRKESFEFSVELPKECEAA